MYTSNSFLLLLLPLVAAFADPALHKAARSRSRHLPANPLQIRHNIKARHDELEHVSPRISKRDSYNGRATFYDVGLGACGWWNVASDYIVAQNSDQFGSSYPSPNCGKSITISYGGKTAVAQIADECPTCPYGGLDMSRSLFDHFASEDVGTFQMTWWYNDGSSSPTTTTTTTQYTPTSTYTPPTSTYVAPTSTYTPPPSTSTTTTDTSTSVPTSTSISTSISITASTSASISASESISASASPSVIPVAAMQNSTVPITSNSTEVGDVGDVEDHQVQMQLGNLVLMSQAVATLGQVVVAAASS
ncbi:hypothetical protein M231_06017 [Tremella mesenterica]|uniref:RlpA-like protein double-psi beta-barrel domain-containing protein n=1 Tax=Tremella mesenterica TaxID=5217 RepID=A0A4Q1BGM8_TREME|nr:hypothetical protein M231_06017 [Tremella mesenterica]